MKISNVICVFNDDGKTLEELIMKVFEEYLKNNFV